MIKKWKSIVKRNLRWSICVWNHYINLLKFSFPVVTPSTRKCVKKVQIGISCTNVDRKMKIKFKNFFEVNYLFLKPFSEISEGFTQCGDAINPKSILLTLWSKNWVKKTQICISCTTSVIFFWWKSFWILKYWSSLGRHYSKTGAIRAELTPEMRFSTSWYCRRFWSLIQLAILQKSYFQGYMFLRTLLLTHCKRSSILQ